MKRTNFSMILSALVLLALILAAPLAWAGIVWQTQEVTQGMPGQPDGTQMVTHMATEDATRTEMDHQVNIMNFNTMTIYNLDTQNKTYNQTNMNEMIQMPQLSGENAKQMAAMMEQMMGTIKVVPTGETQEIEGYQCQKYNVSIMNTKSEYWVTKDIPHYEEFKAIGEKMAEAMGKNPMLKRMNHAAFVKEMDGFPVKSITHTMMGGTIISTLKNVEKKDLSENLFSVPSDYSMAQ